MMTTRGDTSAMISVMMTVTMAVEEDCTLLLRAERMCKHCEHCDCSAEAALEKLRYTCTVIECFCYKHDALTITCITYHNLMHERPLSHMGDVGTPN